MLANGGGSVTLHFQRQPFQSRQVTVVVPWNRIVMMDAVTLMLEDDDYGEQGADTQCDPTVEHDYYGLKPLVLSTWHHSQLGSCCTATTAIVPETQASLLSAKAKLKIFLFLVT
jgi:hypothetical protein